MPSVDPSGKPSRAPSTSPSDVPSFNPSGSPSSKPSAGPSFQPSLVVSFDLLVVSISISLEMNVLLTHTFSLSGSANIEQGALHSAIGWPLLCSLFPAFRSSNFCGKSHNHSFKSFCWKNQLLIPKLLRSRLIALFYPICNPVISSFSNAVFAHARI